MKQLAKKYRVLLASEVVTLGLFFVVPEIAKQTWLNSLHFTGEILLILPPILVLVGLLDSWVPVKAIETHLGPNSGVRGVLLALVVGSITAGPIFAAFPIAASLAKKGARVANMVIFLGAFAAIKIPILMMESQFISLKFALLRLFLTIPLVVLMGFIMEIYLAKARKPELT